jgi:hypothetical protein
LTRDLQPLGEIGLRPVPFSTKDTKAVLHLYLQRFTAWEITITTTNKNPQKPRIPPRKNKGTTKKSTRSSYRYLAGLLKLPFMVGFLYFKTTTLYL